MNKLTKKNSPQRNVVNRKLTIWSIFALILLASFTLTGIGKAESPFNENFDSYIPGNLGGQGNWIQYSGNWTVSQEQSNSAPNSTKANGSAYNYRNETASTTAGTISFYFYSVLSTADHTIFNLAQGEVDSINVEFRYDGKIWLWPDVVIANSYSSGTWNKVTLEYNLGLRRIRGRLNNESWSDWKTTGVNLNYLDRIWLEKEGSNVAYIDDIKNEEPLNPPTITITPTIPTPGATTTYPNGIFAATGTYTYTVTDIPNTAFFKIRYTYATDSTQYWDWSYTLLATTSEETNYEINGLLPTGTFYTSYFYDYAFESDCSIPIWQGNSLNPAIGRTCDYTEVPVTGIAASTIIVETSEIVDYGTGTAPVLTGEQSEWFNSWISRFFNLTSRFPINYIAGFYDWIQSFSSTTGETKNLGEFSLPQMTYNNGQSTTTYTATGTLVTMPNLDNVNIDLPGGPSTNAGTLISNLIKIILISGFLFGSFEWVVGPFLGKRDPHSFDTDA